MLRKNDKFLNNLHTHINQINLTKPKRGLDGELLIQDMKPRGTFNKITEYISDIDFQSSVSFKQWWLDYLNKKIKNLTDFEFIRVNAGYMEEYKPPWEIYQEGIQSKYTTQYNNACDFDLQQTMVWWDNFKKARYGGNNKKMMSDRDLEKVDNILNQETLILGDLVEIENISEKYGTIRWNKFDLKKGEKTDQFGKLHYFLKELETDSGPAAQFVYIPMFPQVVSVDVGLVDRKFRKVFPAPTFYYQGNWYKFLKTYKYSYNLKREHEDEYWEVMKDLEYENALVAKIDLLETMYKYKILATRPSILNGELRTLKK